MRAISRLSLFFVLLFSFFSCTNTSDTALEVASVFGDHMVLQANKPINIWGSVSPSTKVKVLFRDQKLTTKADKEGNWILKLSEEDYGGPNQLTIQTKTDTVIFHDILVGEVWICSGQSNMEMPMISKWAHLNNAEEEVANADFPEIRMFKVGKNIAFEPVDTISTSGWNACTPEIVRDFSATAYFFGRKIYKELNVPVGLIETAWGGTVAEAWTSKSSLSKMSDFKSKLDAIANVTGSRDELMKAYEEDTERMNMEISELDPGLKGGDAIYASKNFDTKDWLDVDLPMMWEESALGNFDGSVWFVKDIQLPAAFSGQDLEISYGAPDDSDEVWFNGEKIGEDVRWNVIRKYTVPAGFVTTGSNRIAIRIYDKTGRGGFKNEAKNFYIKSKSGKSVSIANGWKAAKGFDFSDVKTNPVSPFNPNQVTVLYNGMIYPLLPFTIQGAIWYQGESNAGRAYQYRELFKTMISDWREKWGQGDFAFLFVQLASYQRANEQPVEDTWAELREAQSMALDLPNTGMAVAIDIGDARDIHPGNKQDVGKRLALNALAKVYNKEIAFSGPLYSDMKIVGNKIEIQFDHVYEGLLTSDSDLVKGFAIAGEDRVFHWANAEIADATVLVSSPEVNKPVAVRYGWSANPRCNLVNSEQLPASPFRTDSWKGITE